MIGEYRKGFDDGWHAGWVAAYDTLMVAISWVKASSPDGVREVMHAMTLRALCRLAYKEWAASKWDESDFDVLAAASRFEHGVLPRTRTGTDTKYERALVWPEREREDDNERV